MKNNKKNLKQIIYTIIIILMLINLVYVTTKDNNYVGELPIEDIIREFDIGEIYIPYTTNKSKRKFYENVINEVKQNELSINYKKVGDKFELGEAK